jgi:putative transcriptional regulator
MQTPMTFTSSEKPLDALLASYAVGNVSRPLHALIASHLLLKPDNRAFVSSMEETLAQEMEAALQAAAPSENREKRLASIFDGKDEKIAFPESDPTSLIPAPLAAYLAKPFEDLRWKNVMPGLREVRVEDRAGCEASLLWIKAGRAMPSHTHPGVEATLVIQGSFADNQGEFRRGDMAVVDSKIDHKPIAGKDEDCICFAVSEGPVHLTGPLARIFNWIKQH